MVVLYCYPHDCYVQLACNLDLRKQSGEVSKIPIMLVIISDLSYVRLVAQAENYSVAFLSKTIGSIWSKWLDTILHYSS